MSALDQFDRNIANIDWGNLLKGDKVQLFALFEIYFLQADELNIKTIPDHHKRIIANFDHVLGNYINAMGMYILQNPSVQIEGLLSAKITYAFEEAVMSKLRSIGLTQTEAELSLLDCLKRFALVAASSSKAYIKIKEYLSDKLKGAISPWNLDLVKVLMDNIDQYNDVVPDEYRIYQTLDGTIVEYFRGILSLDQRNYELALVYFNQIIIRFYSEVIQASVDFANPIPQTTSSDSMDTREYYSNDTLSTEEAAQNRGSASIEH